jgi:hypothetical protein
VEVSVRTFQSIFDLFICWSSEVLSWEMTVMGKLEWFGRWNYILMIMAVVGFVVSGVDRTDAYAWNTVEELQNIKTGF